GGIPHASEEDGEERAPGRRAPGEETRAPDRAENPPARTRRDELAEAGERTAQRALLPGEVQQRERRIRNRLESARGLRRKRRDERRGGRSGESQDHAVGRELAARGADRPSPCGVGRRQALGRRPEPEARAEP